MDCIVNVYMDSIVNVLSLKTGMLKAVTSNLKAKKNTEILLVSYGNPFEIFLLCSFLDSWRSTSRKMKLKLVTENLETNEG